MLWHIWTHASCVVEYIIYMYIFIYVCARMWRTLRESTRDCVDMSNQRVTTIAVAHEQVPWFPKLHAIISNHNRADNGKWTTQKCYTHHDLQNNQKSTKVLWSKWNVALTRRVRRWFPDTLSSTREVHDDRILEASEGDASSVAMLLPAMFNTRNLNEIGDEMKRNVHFSSHT